MKTVGTTPEGNFIVEMSGDEYRSFVRLEKSIDGSSYVGFSSPYPTLLGKDLSPVFKALFDVAETKQSIYQMKEYINFLDSVFGNIK